MFDLSILEDMCTSKKQYICGAVLNTAQAEIDAYVRAETEKQRQERLGTQLYDRRVADGERLQAQQKQVLDDSLHRDIGWYNATTRQYSIPPAAFSAPSSTTSSSSSLSSSFSYAAAGQRQAAAEESLYTEEQYQQFLAFKQQNP